ncbi:MAG: sigma-70 family polymerase sigma factor [Sediminibacterium sp.]|nr:sigma-70 family polymerase sigma factor [Sediminibacterium sp.]
MVREINQLASLIAGCCKNDRNSQRDLYHALYDYAMKISYRYVSRVEEAEELTSESFIKLFRNIHQFDGNRGGETEALLKGWFKRIVVNTCIDHLRRTHLKLASQEINEEGETFADIQETGIDKLMYNEIIGAIRKLTPVYRTVFNLFVMEGFSHEEIASQLNISVGASKSNLSKARHNLRKIITKQTEYKRIYA